MLGRSWGGVGVEHNLRLNGNMSLPPAGFPFKEMHPVYFTVQKEGLMTCLYISQERDTEETTVWL